MALGERDWGELSGHQTIIIHITSKVTSVFVKKPELFQKVVWMLES